MNSLSLYKCAVITVHSQGKALVQGNQSKPGLARVEPWSRVTKVSQGWPWFTLVAGDQSNQIQGTEGVIYLTRADNETVHCITVQV